MPDSLSFTTTDKRALRVTVSSVYVIIEEVQPEGHLVEVFRLSYRDFRRLARAVRSLHVLQDAVKVRPHSPAIPQSP